MAALSFSSPAATFTSRASSQNQSPPPWHNGNRGRSNFAVTRCEAGEEPSSASPENTVSSPEAKKPKKLQIGSPVVVVEAPRMIKTAANMPCLRVNSGLVNPGDVGRIVSRKPKDLWAVRLAIGTYLIDGKYFKPLELDD
ncbi:unnamed protein product [Linum trigynum]|uniref:Chlororespiratory reduction 42 n=1 Tax=Linum trigynum TaxID=586398 RepID=A0AAV2G270_9ROSI